MDIDCVDLIRNYAKEDTSKPEEIGINGGIAITQIVKDAPSLEHIQQQPAVIQTTVNTITVPKIDSIQDSTPVHSKIADTVPSTSLSGNEATKVEDLHISPENYHETEKEPTSESSCALGGQASSFSPAFPSTTYRSDGDFQIITNTSSPKKEFGNYKVTPSESLSEVIADSVFDRSSEICHNVSCEKITSLPESAINSENAGVDAIPIMSDINEKNTRRSLSPNTSSKQGYALFASSGIEKSVTSPKPSDICDNDVKETCTKYEDTPLISEFHPALDVNRSSDTMCSEVFSPTKLLLNSPPVMQVHNTLVKEISAPLSVVSDLQKTVEDSICKSNEVLSVTDLFAKLNLGCDIENESSVYLPSKSIVLEMDSLNIRGCISSECIASPEEVILNSSQNKINLSVSNDILESPVDANFKDCIKNISFSEDKDISLSVPTEQTCLNSGSHIDTDVILESLPPADFVFESSTSFSSDKDVFGSDIYSTEHGDSQSIPTEPDCLPSESHLDNHPSNDPVFKSNTSVSINEDVLGSEICSSKQRLSCSDNNISENSDIQDVMPLTDSVSINSIRNLDDSIKDVSFSKITDISESVPTVSDYLPSESHLDTDDVISESLSSKDPVFESITHISSNNDVLASEIGVTVQRLSCSDGKILDIMPLSDSVSTNRTKNHNDSLKDVSFHKITDISQPIPNKSDCLPSGSHLDNDVIQENLPSKDSVFESITSISSNNDVLASEVRLTEQRLSCSDNNISENSNIQDVLPLTDSVSINSARISSFLCDNLSNRSVSTNDSNTSILNNSFKCSPSKCTSDFVNMDSSYGSVHSCPTKMLNSTTDIEKSLSVKPERESTTDIDSEIASITVDQMSSEEQLAEEKLSSYVWNSNTEIGLVDEQPVTPEVNCVHDKSASSTVLENYHISAEPDTLNISSNVMDEIKNGTRGSTLPDETPHNEQFTIFDEMPLEKVLTSSKESGNFSNDATQNIIVSSVVKSDNTNAEMSLGKILTSSPESNIYSNDATQNILHLSPVASVESNERLSDGMLLNFSGCEAKSEDCAKNSLLQVGVVNINNDSFFAPNPVTCHIASEEKSLLNFSFNDNSKSSNDKECTPPESSANINSNSFTTDLGVNNYANLISLTPIHTENRKSNVSVHDSDPIRENMFCENEIAYQAFKQEYGLDDSLIAEDDSNGIFSSPVTFDDEETELIDISQAKGPDFVCQQNSSDFIIRPSLVGISLDMSQVNIPDFGHQQKSSDFVMRPSLVGISLDIPPQASLLSTISNKLEPLIECDVSPTITESDASIVEVSGSRPAVAEQFEENDIQALILETEDTVSNKNSIPDDTEYQKVTENDNNAVSLRIPEMQLINMSSDNVLLLSDNSDPINISPNLQITSTKCLLDSSTLIFDSEPPEINVNDNSSETVLVQIPATAKDSISSPTKLIQDSVALCNENKTDFEIQEEKGLDAEHENELPNNINNMASAIDFTVTINNNEVNKTVESSDLLIQPIPPITCDIFNDTEINNIANGNISFAASEAFYSIHEQFSTAVTDNEDLYKTCVMDMTQNINIDVKPLVENANIGCDFYKLPSSLAISLSDVEMRDSDVSASVELSNVSPDRDFLAVEEKNLSVASLQKSCEETFINLSNTICVEKDSSVIIDNHISADTNLHFGKDRLLNQTNNTHGSSLDCLNQDDVLNENNTAIFLERNNNVLDGSELIVTPTVELATIVPMEIDMNSLSMDIITRIDGLQDLSDSEDVRKEIDIVPVLANEGTNQEQVILSEEESFEILKAEVEQLKKIKASLCAVNNNIRSQTLDLLNNFQPKDMQMKSKISELKTQRHDVGKERDQAWEDIRNVEKAFSELMSRYEKTKSVLEQMKENEALLKKQNDNLESDILDQEKKYDLLQTQAEEKLILVNDTLVKTKKEKDSEKATLSVMLRRSEIKIRSLANTLEQKVSENMELSRMCDEFSTGH